MESVKKRAATICLHERLYTECKCFELDAALVQHCQAAESRKTQNEVCLRPVSETALGTEQ